jgi:hypothetical protein
MRLLRIIPKSFWSWMGIWFAALCFLLPALKHYGKSRAIDHRADHLLMALLFLSYPISAAAGAFVALVGPVAGVFAHRETGADFVLTALWWFVAGYMQWFLLFRLIRVAAAGRSTKPDASN